MSKMQMDQRSRDLILAAEISGLLHDLGKLRPEFASEKMGEADYRDRAKELGFGDAHGAILEDPRIYPPAGEEPWLALLKRHDGWAQALCIPEEWSKSNTPQARGLGDPLRQHHANNNFPADQLSLFGLLYMFGADTRDSAMDKGSGGTLHCDQRVTHGFIADSFGNEDEPYSPETLGKRWPLARQIIEATLLADGAERDLPKARQLFCDGIKDIFLYVLGETRRPTNDVTLWHHAYSTASLFKAAVAECVLRRDFTCRQQDNGHFDEKRMGRVRFRLLGIRWNWAALSSGALQPVVLTALAENRQQAMKQLRQRLEVDYPIGNLVYQDDNGAVFVVGSFYQGTEDADRQNAEVLFRQHILDPLQAGILQDLAPLGAGASIRLAWTKPRLYLTDYPEVMATDWTEESGDRQRLVQVGEDELRRLWAKQTGEGQQVQICPQCGLRPGQARELAINQGGLDADDDNGPSGLCCDCEKFTAKSAHDQRRGKAKDFFGFEPHTFNLQTILRERNLPGNGRLVMLSVRVNPETVASGSALLTQLARPLVDLKLFENSPVPIANDQGDIIHKTLEALARNEGNGKLNENGNWIRALLGDSRWLTKSDGRAEGSLKEKARHLLSEFFLLESIPDDAGLYRHDGDKLLLFGMRKHASPGRLARTWDDLRTLWQKILRDIAGDTEHWLMPLSLDAGGFRVIVAANDARQALGRIQQRVNETLSKVRAGLDVHVSALAFREKFPLYIALDALRRMERRIATVPPQSWTLLQSAPNHDGMLTLNWDTPQGPAQWTVSLKTGDPNQPDLWYPHAICTSRPEGPGRLVRLDQLEPGEIIRLRPSTFDFMALDGTARRYDLRYDPDTGKRPHFVLGESGRRPFLLEQLDELLNLSGQTGWKISQTKGLLGQIIECYEKWVRDAPTELLQTQGRSAWQSHCAALFRRYLKAKPEIRDRCIALFQDEERACLFFDAFEWSGFIEKDAQKNAQTPVEESEPA